MIHFFWIATWSYLGRRVQLSRRMDQAALEVAASRQAAETAIAQVECCRMPRHSLVFLFQKGPSDPSRWYQNISERYQVIDRFDAIWACFYGAKVAALRAELASIIGQNGEEVKPKTVAEDHQDRAETRNPRENLVASDCQYDCHSRVNLFFFAYGHERLATGRSSYLIWWRAVMVRWCKRRLQSWWVPLSIVLSCCNVTWFCLNLLLDSAAFWLTFCCWNYSQSRPW